VRTPEGDTDWRDRSGFVVEPKAPFVEFSYMGRHKAPSIVEKARIRIMSALHAASKVMELGPDDEAAAADLLFRFVKGNGLINNERLRLLALASIIITMWRRGIVVRADDVYRAYGALGGTLADRTDRKKLDYKLNALMMRIFSEVGARSDRDGLKESAAQALAGELGLDDASSAVLVALAKAINDKPVTAANVAAMVISYITGRWGATRLWDVVWPPRSQRARIDGLTVVLGDGDHVNAEVEENTVKVVCSRCGSVIYNNTDPESFPYVKGLVLYNLLSKAPHVCPRCGAGLADGRRVLVRAIGLKYHLLISSSKGTKIEKKEAKVVLPKGAALQVRKR
jgi:ribosomal protein S27AE